MAALTLIGCEPDEGVGEGAGTGDDEEGLGDLSDEEDRDGEA